MGGPPITFPTPNFLIATTLRKLDFYAPLPHFENPCLLHVPMPASVGPPHAARSLRAAKTTWKTLPLPLPQLPLVFLLPLLIVALLLVSLCVLCVRSGAPVTHRRPLEPKSR